MEPRRECGRAGKAESDLRFPSTGVPTRNPVSVDAAEPPVASARTAMAPLLGMLMLRPPPRGAVSASGGVARLAARPVAPLEGCWRAAGAPALPGDSPKGDGPEAEDRRDAAVAGDARNGGRGGSACCAGEVPIARWMAVCAMGRELVRRLAM
jgi:hypothetical protein